MEGVGALAGTTHNPQDFCATCFGGVVGLKHQRGRAFGHHKTVPGSGKWFGCALRVIVLGGKSGEQRETDNHFLAYFTVGSDTEGSIGVATTYRFNAQLHGSCTRSASGCQ